MSMNNITMVGRLTRDPEMKYIQSSGKEIAIARFTLAVDRDYKNITFLAKSRKTFRIEIFMFPDLFHIAISERDHNSVWEIFQQVLVSRVTYTITYLRPFNLNS